MMNKNDFFQRIGVLNPSSQSMLSAFEAINIPQINIAVPCKSGSLNPLDNLAP